MEDKDVHRHDISDESWKKLEPLLPEREGGCGGCAKNNRRFINAVFRFYEPGLHEETFHHHAEAENTHRRFCRWQNKSIWENLQEQFISEHELEWIMIDAICVKAHAHACGARGGNQEIASTKGGSTPRYI